MTEPTPDYAGLIAEAEAAQEWMRQPDWADNFSLGDMVDWLRQRPTSILPKLTTALRTLLERSAALKRERDQLWDKLHCMCGSPIDHSAWEGHTPVSVYDYSLDQERSRAEAAEAERDRLKERVAELEKALEPFAREAEDWSPEANGGHVFDDAESIAGETSITVGHLRTARAYRDKRSKQ